MLAIPCMASRRIWAVISTSTSSPFSAAVGGNGGARRDLASEWIRLARENDPMCDGVGVSDVAVDG
jgi:hypothetical protein